jgi:hypothetical protein
VSAEQTAAPKGRPVTARSVLIGLLGAALLCAITPYNDYKIGATYLAGNQFPVGAVFALLVLAAPINALLRRFAPAKAFSGAELLTIWTLMLVASGLPSSGMMRFFLPHIAAPAYFSNGVNNWEQLVWGGLPDWLSLSDRDAAKAYFAGYPRGAEHIPWGAWIRPLLGWGAFAACFFVATFSLANLLRRQWIENEKFVFPLVSLPLLLAEDPAPGTGLPPILRHPLLWCAVAFTTGLHGLNGLHQLYPTIPAVQTAIHLDAYLTSPPWNQIGQVPALFFPLVVGLSFLLPAEVAFSLWFFFFFTRRRSCWARRTTGTCRVRSAVRRSESFMRSRAWRGAGLDDLDAVGGAATPARRLGEGDQRTARRRDRRQRRDVLVPGDRDRTCAELYRYGGMVMARYNPRPADRAQPPAFDALADHDLVGRDAGGDALHDHALHVY